MTPCKNSTVIHPVSKQADDAVDELVLNSYTFLKLPRHNIALLRGHPIDNPLFTVTDASD